MSSSLLSPQHEVTTTSSVTTEDVVHVKGLSELNAQLVQATIAALGEIEIPVGHLTSTRSTIRLRSLEDIQSLEGDELKFVLAHIAHRCGQALEK